MKLLSKSSEGPLDLQQYQPHIWALSLNAYVQLFLEDRNQAIVISGESGAGKTENAKLALKFLTAISRTNRKESLKSNTPNIEQMIIKCNPVLEAFGNAKTVRNDNSSRFGKYLNILIHQETRQITGANIINYLLEKSRVSQISKGERNYHIFYLFLKGSNELAKYNLSNNPAHYFYLNQSG